MHLPIEALPSRATAQRIDAVGWGSLFVITGAIMLMPGLPDGAWLIGFGTIMVAVNLARIASGYPPEWLWIIVGSGALLAGIGAIAGMDLPVLALVLIACGIAAIGGTVRNREDLR